ncbi:adenylate/guanylate cyclase domain-containing protein [Micromonospora sp. NPDC006431]|uniref:adenylate/guanylate cyclase domain-containing protein n=1 Tax=Micromonospora sp. NPDC006431 TaxID=3364235 RepID=UPI0036BAB3AD
MGLLDEITTAVRGVVTSDWNTRKGNVVPKTEDVALSNGAVELDAVYLYADMANSTILARDFSPTTAAKVIRSYLDATCRVIRARGGEIRSFDGDRVMAVFLGDTKNSTAAKCGLQINYVVKEIVRPAIEASLPSIKKQGFVLHQGVGVASGTALVVRGGVRGNSDLVSVGRSPNVAAKLSDLRQGTYRTYITSDVFDMLLDWAKLGGDDKRLMWDGPETTWIGERAVSVYRSGWQWKP